jgi:chromosome partitioning protein
MAKVITVCLRKGGSGKTTTSVNVAAGLQLRGKRTLLIDLDDQANATMSVGINPFAVETSIDTLLSDIKASLSEAILPTEFGLSIIAAKQNLESVAAGMTATSIGALRPITEALDSSYDYIVIDTQPGHSYLSISALVAADYALIPLQTHYLAMEGVARILDDIGNVKNGLNSHLEVLGIIPCMVQNTKISQGVIDKTKADYPDMLLPVEIRLSVQFINSTLEGIPIVVSNPTHSGAKEYMKLVDMLLEKMGDTYGEK